MANPPDNPTEGEGAEPPFRPLLPGALRNAINGKGLSPEDKKRLFPVSAKAEADKEARKKQAQDFLEKNRNQLIPDRGIYFGAWTPHDRDGRPLGKTFNMFAAPYDYGFDEYGHGSRSSVPYSEENGGDVTSFIAGLYNYLGHNGFSCLNDTKLYEALSDGTYNGGWFLPTRDLLGGRDLSGLKIQTDNLYDHRDRGAFKGTFITAANPDHAQQYWSCTELTPYTNGLYCTDFSKGKDYWLGKIGESRGMRLVRAELRV